MAIKFHAPTDEDIGRRKSLAEISFTRKTDQIRQEHAELAKAHPPKPDGPTQYIGIRVPIEVIDHFKGDKPKGYQTRMVAALLAMVRE